MTYLDFTDQKDIFDDVRELKNYCTNDGTFIDQGRLLVQAVGLEHVWNQRNSLAYLEPHQAAMMVLFCDKR